MKFTETFKYPAGVEDVFALISDDAFRTKSAEEAKGRDVSATVEKDGDETVVTLVRTQQATFPDFIQKFVGDSVKIKQVERWQAPAADGSRSGTITVKVSGQPAGFKGKASLKPAGKGTDFTVDGDVKVDVPFVGKKVEPLVAKAIAAALRYDVTAGVKRLD